MTIAPGEWERCGNTVFYVKTRPHDRVGYIYIDPSEFTMVKWEENPNGMVVTRREVPAEHDWAVAEMLRLQLSKLPVPLQRRFWTWTNFLDIFKQKGLSPSAIVNNFHQGFVPHERNETLDALEHGVFTADVPWVEQSNLAKNREELDEALSDFGVMECM